MAKAIGSGGLPPFPLAGIDVHTEKYTLPGWDVEGGARRAIPAARTARPGENFPCGDEAASGWVYCIKTPGGPGSEEQTSVIDVGLRTEG